MRMASKGVSVVLLCLILLAACGAVTPIAPIAQTPMTSQPTLTKYPTVIKTPTSPSTRAPTLALATIPIPSLGVETPIPDSRSYHLMKWSPENAEALFRLMENYPETLSFIDRGYHDHNYLASFYYATWAGYEALLRFPYEPRAKRWKWWLSNDISRSYQFSASGSAGSYYAALISERLNSGEITLKNLTGWISTNNPDSQTAIIRLNTPDGFVASYVLQIDSVYLWILEISNGFQVYPLIDNFYYYVSKFETRDLTGDNIPEFIPSFFRETNFVTGVSEIYAWDLSRVPYRKLPFVSAQYDSLDQYGSLRWIGYDWSIVQTADAASVIRVKDEYLLFCPIYRIEDYRWNGRWFELSETQFEFDQTKAQDLKYCDQFSLGSAFLYAKPNETISLYESLIPYWPISDNYFKPPVDAKDELRFRLGVLNALSGNSERATGYFEDVAHNPSVANSSWIAPAKKFLDSYSSPEQIYRACSTTSVCNPKFAVEQLVAGIKPNDYVVAIEKLKVLGVPVLASSLYEFDGDDFPEFWFTVRNPNTKEIEFWILSKSPNKLIAQYQYYRQLRGRNWLKSGMHHAQTGNLLENLSQ